MKIFSLLFLIQLSQIQGIEFFFLPKEGTKAEQSLIVNINNAKKSIDVAMFMVTNKKLTNALKSRAERGNIRIRLIADESYDRTRSKHSRVRSLLSQTNISLFTIKGLPKKKNKFGIMHAKLVIIDDSITYIGSTNWTKSAFHNNYEILVKIKDLVTTKLYQDYFNEILSKAQVYQ